MRGQNHQPVGVHVDEGHHHRGFGVSRLRQLAGAGLGLGRRGGRVFLGVIQRGLVAVVAVGDDQLLVGHGRGQQVDGRRIADLPQPVQHAVLVGDLGVGGPGAVVQNLLDAAGRVGVEHEDLPEMRVRGLEQVEPVALGLAERLLVAEDHLLGVLVQLAEGDEAAPLLDDLGAGNLEALRVGEDAGVFFLRQHALLAPGAEVARRAGIDALAALGVEQFRQAQDDAHQVVGAALVVGLLHGRRDLVVGLGDHVLQTDGGGIVAPGAKGINAGHAEGLAPRSNG